MDLSPFFNGDVVVDPGDETNDAFDGDGRSHLVADGYDGTETRNETVRGLPLDRRIGVHLLGTYGDPNVLQIGPQDSAPVRVVIPPRRYVALRLLVSGGNGDSRVPARLEYSDGSSDEKIIPCDDWYHDKPPDPLGNLQSGLSPVWNGMDRIYRERPATLEDDPALFEHIVVTAPEKKLVAIELLPADGSFSGADTRFNLFAITGVAE